jgi:hypothetical protein
MNKEDYKKEVLNWLEIAGKKPGKEMIELSNDLIREEQKELQDAIDDNDKTEIVDALIDITWVLHNKLFANKYDYNTTMYLERHLKTMRSIDYHIDKFIPEMLNKYSIDTELFNIYQKAVLDSNYSKFCKTIQEHIDTRAAYGSGKHFDKPGKIVFIEDTERLTFPIPVIQKETGKILKSINYKPAEELFKLYSNNKTFQ